MRHRRSLQLFQEQLNSLTALEFERLVLLTIRGMRIFERLDESFVVGGSQVDAYGIARDEQNQLGKECLIEIKHRRIVSLSLLEEMLGKWHRVRLHFPDAQLLLIVSGTLTDSTWRFAKESGIQLWDSVYLSNIMPEDIFQVSAEYDHNNCPEEPRAASLKKSLMAILPGRAEWRAYQQIASEILEFLFCPPLAPPRNEFTDADGRNRRDMIFENFAVSEFWREIRKLYSGHYIVADAKNYAAALGKKPVLELAHYLKPYGCGMFGLIISRKGPGLSAAHAIRENWIGANKMIVVLSDQDLIDMLEVKTKGGGPEELVRKHIADFRLSL